MYNYDYSYKAHIDLIYPSLTADDRIPNNVISLAEQRLGFGIPAALRAFYLLAGNRKDITKSYNRLLEIKDLLLKDDILIFFEENQAVIIWGIRSDDVLIDNPIVFVAENKPYCTWKSTYRTISDFLISMLYWQAVNGGLPYVAITSGIHRDVRSQLKEWLTMKLGLYFDNMEMFVTNGKVICVAGEDASFDLYAGGRGRDDFMEIDRLLGIEWDYSTVYDDE